MSWSRQRLPALVLFAVAACVRWLYVWEVGRIGDVHLLSVDGSAYHGRALEILSGAWVGDGVFYQDPLYPYFLAGLYAVFGTHPLAVFLVQGLLDAGTVVLIHLIAVRLFGRRAGLVAGVLAAFYGPFLYYDALLLKSALSVFLVTLALFLLVRADADGRRRTWLLGGLALGLACLTRGNYLVLLPVALLWAWISSRGGRGTSLVSAGLVVAGLALAILPVSLRNQAVGGDLVLITSQAGQNFFIGNHRGNDTGTYKAPPFVFANPTHEESDFAREARRRTGREMQPSEISRFWFRETLGEIALDPGHFARHTLKKTRLLFNDYEVPDNQSYDFTREHVSRLLALPLPDYGLLLPLALCGAFFARRSRGAWLLMLSFASYGATVVLFYNTSRYRIPVAPVVIVFAAVAVSHLVDALRDRGVKTLAASAGFLALAYPLVHQPVMRIDFSTHHYNVGQHLAQRAESHQAAAVDLERAGETAAAALEWEEADRLRARAEEELRRGLEIRPDHRALRPALRSLLLARVVQAEREGRYRDAAALARELTAAFPGFADGFWHLGASLARSGDEAGARLALRRALGLRPGHAGARRELRQLGRDAGEGAPAGPEGSPGDGA